MTPVHTSTAPAQGFEISSKPQLEHSFRCPFLVRILNFQFRARQLLVFPKGKAANTLRGALGMLLTPTESAWIARPSGLATPPGPYVFRASHLDSATIYESTTFQFRIHLFYLAADTTITDAFARLDRLGADRRQVELISVERRDVTLELLGHVPTSRLTVTFLTPTELKGGTVPTFPLLAARIRDRLSTLRSLYGEGPLRIDFREQRNLAEQTRLVKDETHPVEVLRRSSRTGQRHSLGGFIGKAEYAGDVGDFVLQFTAASYIGVGRHTLFGNGEISIEY